jgi:hypothetical protein
LFCLVCLLGFFACEKDEFVPFPDSDGTLTVPPPTVATSIRQLSGKERKTLINQIMAGETGKSFAKSQIAYLDSTLSAPAMVVYDSLNDSDVYTFFLSKPAIDTLVNIVVEIPRAGGAEVYSFLAEYVMDPGYAQDLAAEIKTIQQYEGKVSLYPIGKLIDYQQKCGGKCNSIEKCLEIVFGVPVQNGGGGSGTGTGDGPGSIGTLTYSSVILTGSSGGSSSNTGGNTGTGTGTGDGDSGTGDGGTGDGGGGTGGDGGMPPLPSEPGCYELLLASGPYLSPEDRLRLGTWNRVPCPAPTGNDENIGFPDTPTERMPTASLAKDPDMRDCCTRLLTSVGILTGPLQNEDEEYFQRIHEFSLAYGFNYGTLLQLIDRDELNACTTGSSADCIFSQIFDYLDQQLYTDLPVTPGQIQASGVNRTYLQSNPDQAAAVFRFVRQYEGDAAAEAAARTILFQLSAGYQTIDTVNLLARLKTLFEVAGEAAYPDLSVEYLSQITQIGNGLTAVEKDWLAGDPSTISSLSDYLPQGPSAELVNRQVASIVYVKSMSAAQGDVDIAEFISDFSASGIDPIIWGILKEFLAEIGTEIIRETLIDIVPGASTMIIGPQMFDSFEQGDCLSALGSLVEIILNEADILLPAAKVAALGAAIYNKAALLKKVYGQFKRLKKAGDKAIVDVYETMKQHLGGPGAIMRKWKRDGGQTILEGVNQRDNFYQDLVDRLENNGFFMFNGYPVYRFYQTNTAAPAGVEKRFLYITAYEQSNTIDPSTGAPYPLTIKFFTGPSDLPFNGTNIYASPFKQIFIIRLR